jgi:tetratricopeptide (TPR) repeat protein
MHHLSISSDNIRHRCQERIPLTLRKDAQSDEIFFGVRGRLAASKRQHKLIFRVLPGAAFFSGVTVPSSKTLRRSGPLLSCILLCFTVWCLATFSPSARAGDDGDSEPAIPPLPIRPADPQNAVAFDRFYNLDYDRSINGFEKILGRHPSDPFAFNHLLTALMYRELYRMGALNTGEYVNQSFLATAHRPADPKVKEQIRQLVDRAEQLEATRLKANSNDVDALYARGVTRAQFAIYTALFEHAWFSALRNSVGARHDHERVLSLDPQYMDAKLVVGVHNCITGSLSWGARLAASLVGISGNKELGLRDLYEVANSNSETSVDAKFALILFLRREHRYEEALPILRSLIQRYPRNVLLAVEEGALLRAIGRYGEAEAVYRRVWQNGRNGKYPGLHYEMAALHLGDMLRSQKNYSDATGAYELVSQVENPDPEMLQKANLAAGEMYDLQKKRELAVQKYDAVIATNATTPPAETARRRLKEPYSAN